MLDSGNVCSMAAGTHSNAALTFVLIPLFSLWGDTVMCDVHGLDDVDKLLLICFFNI